MKNHFLLFLSLIFKFNATFGYCSPNDIATINSINSGVIITKASNKSIYAINEKATFIVTISNYTSKNVIIDSIVDQLPNGFTFKSILSGSDINTSNSSFCPSTNTANLLRFISKGIEDANNRYQIESGESLTLIYTATASNVAQVNLKTSVTGYSNGAEIGPDQNIISVLNILPHYVFLLRGYAKENYNELSWIVYNNEKTKSYTIEYSFDGYSWNTLEKQEINCSSNQNLFKYRHNITENINCYYRILQEDCYGVKQYSKTTVLQRKQSNSAFKLIESNFRNGYINVQVNSSGLLRLFNNFGVLIFNKYLSTGNHFIYLNQLPRGLYIIKFNGNICKVLN